MRRTVFGIMLTVPFVIMLTLAFNIQSVKTGGTIYIRADGSIDPPTAAISSVDNVTYTFTDNINDFIVVERSNITIEGAGYTLQGSGSGNGFYINSINNVTIQNTNIKNFNVGVYVYRSSNNIVFDNNITNHYSRGVYVYQSSNNIVSDNNIANNGDGVYIHQSSNNTVLGNTITDCSYNVFLYQSSNSIISGNNIANNTGYCFRLWQHCDNNTISNNNITNNNRGVQLWSYCDNNTISGNKIAGNNNFGVHLYEYCDNNTVSGNTIANNGDGVLLQESSNDNNVFGNNITNNNFGVRLYQSSSNVLRNNSIAVNQYNFGVYGDELSHFVHDVDSWNTVDGKPIYYWINQQNMTVPSDAGYVGLVDSYNVTVEGFELKNNGQGVLLANTTNSRITDNNITNNDDDGVYLAWSSNHNTVSGNNITNNGNVGVVLYQSCTNNTVSSNKITNSYYGVVIAQSSNNTVSGNSITNNSPGSGVRLDQSSDNIVSGNNIANNARYGVELYQSSNNTVSGNQMTSNVQHCVYLYSSSNNIVSGNNITSNSYRGVYLYQSSSNTISGNNIKNNRYYPGIFLEQSCSSNIVSGNNITSNSDGVALFHSCSSNIISGNNITNNYQRGVYLYQHCDSNTVSNNTITSNGHIGVHLHHSCDSNAVSGNNVTNNGSNGVQVDYSSTNNTVSGNNITNNNYGVSLYQSSNSTVSRNNITNNSYGVYLYQSSGNVLRNNTIAGNGYNFGVYGDELSHFVHDVDSWNTVDGKPIYYWINQQNVTVPSDAGYVGLVNSYNITVEGFELKNNGQGVLLANTTNSKITDNNITNNNDDGVYLVWWASNNSVSGNNITNNGNVGVVVAYQSSNNTVSGNNITSCYHGVVIYQSSNSVSGNTITNNSPGDGVRLDRSSNTTVTGNDITSNARHGVELYLSPNNTVSGNQIVGNVKHGVYFSSSSDNVVSGNNITGNSDDGVRFYYSGGNVVSGNNITSSVDHGVFLDHSPSNVFSGNNIARNRHRGVFLTYSSSNVFSDNKITDTLHNHAVFLYQSCSGNTFSGNNITNNAGHGLWLYPSSGSCVVSENTIAWNGNGFLTESSNNNASRNTIVNNGGWGALLYGSNNNFSMNTVANHSSYGVYLYQASNYVLGNNSIAGNGYNFGVYGTQLSHFVHDINSSNTVDGKPIYYWINQQNTTVPSDAGYIGLVNSVNITVEGFELKNNWQGVLLANTTNSNIRDNNITNNNYGAYLYYSNNNSFYHNNFTGNTQQVHVDPSNYGNVWDDGYPSGGNYWSDYTGVDLYSGPYQNETGGGDGIGDTPYEINADNIDHYPRTLNSPPTQPVVDVTPNSPFTTNDLTCTVTTPSSDPDNDTITYTYEWYKNEVLQPSLTTVTTALSVTIDATNTAKGEVWKCVVTPNDGIANGPTAQDQVTIGNTPPTAPIVDVTPNSPVTVDDLTCTVTAPSSDPDGDTITYTYEWYRDTGSGFVLQPALTTVTTALSVTIGSSNTAKADVWRCIVTPNDGMANGPSDQDEVTIGNSVPSIDGVNISPDPAYTTSTLLATPYGWYDADGDPEGYVYQWQKWDGSSWQDIPGATASTLGPANFVKDDQIRIVCTPYDGTGYGSSKEDTITISNSAPTAPTVDVTPNSPVTVDDLTCTVTAPSSDPDGDTITYTYEWYRDQGAGFVLQPSLTTVTTALSVTIDSSNTAKGEVWRCVVTSNDGTANGPSAQDEVVIENSPLTIDSHYPLANPTILEGESQEFNITKFDLDGDPLTVTWWLNQSDTGETSNSYTYTANYESAGTYNVTVIVSDGVSQTSYQWTLTITNVERDLTINNLTLSRNIVGEGYSTTINITITNQGELTEAFNVTAYANTTIIKTLVNITLTSGNSTTVTFTWNTTGVAKGNYTISAVADAVPGETDTADNTYIDGTVLVTIPGDVDGDGDVDIYDIVKLCVAYGSKKGDAKYVPNCDINCDGKIDIYDVVIACTHYGQKDS